MNTRLDALRIVNELHGARVSGDLNAVCRVFAVDGHFRIAGASADKPIAIVAEGLADFRPWLNMMLKVYQLRNYELIRTVVDWPKVVVNWRAAVFSKVTGVTAPTEFVDMIEIRDTKIVSYDEFFVPCEAFRPAGEQPDRLA
jgi:ketosteroid isomerase-like protein